MSFFKNDPLIAGILAWFTAQIIKIAISLTQSERVSLKNLFTSGGLPSSHAACVCALTTCIAMEYGAATPYFGIAAIFGFIVMYDAMGVRRETGEQSKILNRISRSLLPENDSAIPTKKLKELIGHTPLQVLLGALLGFAIGVIYPFLTGNSIYAA